MSRWQLRSSPVLGASDSNLSLPATPRRQPSRHQNVLPTFDKLELMDAFDTRQTRSEEFGKEEKVSHTQRKRSLSEQIHPFFSDTLLEEKPKIELRDCAPPQPQRNESLDDIDDTEPIDDKGPKRHRRQRSKSLDKFCLSAKKEDSPPPKPQRISSRADLVALRGRSNVGHRRNRSRSLDWRMVNVVSMSPPCEQSRGLCHQPSRSVAVPSFPVLNHKGKSKRDATAKGKRNHRRTRSRSLDLKLTFGLLSTPKCENSRGPPSLIGNSPTERFPSDGTPTTQKMSNTSQRHNKDKHRRMRSRSLDLRELQPAFSIPQTTPSSEQPSARKSPEGRSTWAVPSYPQRRLLRRISSITMDDDPLLNTSIPQSQHRRNISSLTMDDHLLEQFFDRAEPIPTREDPNREETKWLLPTASRKVMKERNKPKRARESLSSCEEEPLEQSDDLEQTTEQIQSVLPPPPPPPPPPPSIRSKYTPPRPLDFSATTSTSGSPWTYTRKNKNRPKMSPFVSKVLGVSNGHDGRKTLRPHQESKEAPPPPPPPAVSPRIGDCFDSNSPHIWLLEDRKTSSQYNENVNRGQSISSSYRSYQHDERIITPKSRGSGGSTRSSRVYKPPLPLQSVSVFLMRGPGTVNSE